MVYDNVPYVHAADDVSSIVNNVNTKQGGKLGKVTE